jgi:ATP-dependent helicase/nuclease subunit B
MPVVLYHNAPASTLSIRERVRRLEFDSFVAVVPTHRRLRHLTREIIRSVPGSTVPALPLHTLGSLATIMFQNLFGPQRIVEGPVQALLYDGAVKACARDLRYFTLAGRDARMSRGTFEKIIDVINNLKESGIYPEILEEEISAAELDEQQKLRDIAAIYKSYDAALDAMGAVDMGGLFKSLRLHCTQPQFERSFRNLFPNVNTISLAGFDEFTEPELDFIRKLCAVKELSVSLVFDYLAGNSELFGHLEENYRRFREMGFADRGARSVAASTMPMLTDQLRMPEVQESVGHLARRLFNTKETSGKIDLSQYVVVSQARNRTQEVELICKIIKRLALDRPERDLSRVCVAMFQPQLYTDIMRVMFPKYGIPVNITDRYALARSPVVVAIMALLQIPIRGFRRDDVLRALRTPYSVFGDAKSAIDYGNLVAISSQLKITVGYNTWLKRIGDRSTLVNGRMEGSSDEDERRSLSYELERLKKARADIEWLNRLFAEINQTVRPREFQHLLLRLLDRLAVPSRLVSGPSDMTRLHREKDTRAYAKFLEVVEEAVALMEIQGEGEKPHSLRYYVDHLNVAILRQRYNVREQFGSGVLVTAIEETRGLPLDVMILAGLIDGEFPSAYQPEVFFSAKRMALREQRHVWQNRYQFYQAVTNWSERLYLTYPEKDGDLELVRSTFIDAVTGMADVTTWNYPEKAPFGEGFYSDEDLLRYAGANTDDPLYRDIAPPDLQETLNEIKKAIDVERSRTETHFLLQYEGLIFDHLSPEGKESLAQLRNRTYSASQMETYGKCPYQFFAQRLLQLKVVEELDEELSPLEKGSVLHEALFEFYTERRDKDLPQIAGCSDKEYEEAVQQLTRITEAKLAEREIPDAFWELEKESILGEAGTSSGLLRRFIDSERSRMTSLQPRYFEVAFGSKVGPSRGKDPILSTEETVSVGSVKMRGKVDRIEVGDKAFAIVDYKTGKDIARIDDIRQGISLQLPLYLYAMESLLARNSATTLQPAAGLYYQLRDKVRIQVGIASAEYKGIAFDKAPSKQLLPTNDELSNVINEAVAIVNRYVEDMAEGKFPLTTPDKVQKVCVFCDYKTICRIQTVRRVPQEKPEDA